MARLSEVNDGLVDKVAAALAAASIAGVRVGSEFPPIETRQNVGKGGPAVIGVIHRHTHFKPGNMSFEHSETVMPCGIAGTLSDFSLAAGQTLTLTIGFAEGSSGVNVGDMISFNLFNGDGHNGATYTAVQGDTLSSVATALAAKIETKFDFVSAVPSGAAIEITNEGSESFRASSFVGEKSIVKEAVSWATRSMQFMIWSGNTDDKYLLHGVIEELLGELADDQGLFLSSGEWVDLMLDQTIPDNAEVDKDVYCDIFIFTVKHMVDRTTEKWSVISPKPEITN